MDSVKDFIIFSFLFLAVALQLFSRYKSNKNKKEWMSDYEKYQQDYKRHISLDDALKRQNDSFKSNNDEK